MGKKEVMTFTMDIKSTDRIIISGLPGTGKTYFLRYLASLAEPDILIVD